MNLIKNFMALGLIMVMCACSHKPTQNLVGSDRDDHGCIASAGYRWSEAMKDCIRIWEVGERAVNGEKNLFVVFSPDSSVAEVYAEGEKCIVCRQKNTDLWISKNGKTMVYRDSETLKVNFGKIQYTGTVKK